MSAMRKFAVLESSLLARKGQAQPAYPQHAHEANAVTRVDDYVMTAPQREAYGADPESSLASLIVRPVLRVPTGPAEPKGVEFHAVEAKPAEAEVSAVEVLAVEASVVDVPVAETAASVVDTASAEPAPAMPGFLDPRDMEPAVAVQPAPVADEAEGRSLREVVKVWTRKVAKDRRLAANLHPRGLNREQAAEYVGLSVSTFNKLVTAGVLPQALAFGRRRVWDRRVLDKALDGMSGIDPAAFAAVPHDA